MRTHTAARRSEPIPDATPTGPAPWAKMLEAAQQRFPEPEFEVSCDDRHTIWVKRTDGTRSLGLSQWLLRRSTLEEIMAGAEAKLIGKPHK